MFSTTQQTLKLDNEEEESILIPMNAEFHSENKSYYLSEQERENYVVYFDEGKLCNVNDKILSCKSLLYVIDKNDCLYAINKKHTYFHHSYFIAGEPLKAAGVIETDYIGEIGMISNESGHYTPKTFDMIPALVNLFDEYIQSGQNAEQAEYHAHDNVVTEGLIYLFSLSDIFNFEFDEEKKFVEYQDYLQSKEPIRKNQHNFFFEKPNKSKYEDTLLNLDDNTASCTLSRYGLHLKK